MRENNLQKYALRMHLLEDIMLQSLERAARDSNNQDISHDRRATGAAVPLKVALRSTETAAMRSPETHGEEDDGLAAAAGPIMVAAYAVVLIVAILAFKANGEALLAVAVSIAFAIVFFAVPLAMMRVRARHDARWRKDGAARDSETVGTFTGRIRRTEAVVQMVIVPVVVSAAFIAFAVIRVLVRL
jgi:hypothetical protein